MPIIPVGEDNEPLGILSDQCARLLRDSVLSCSGTDQQAPDDFGPHLRPCLLIIVVGQNEGRMSKLVRAAWRSVLGSIAESEEQRPFLFLQHVSSEELEDMSGEAAKQVAFRIREGLPDIECGRYEPTALRRPGLVGLPRPLRTAHVAVSVGKNGAGVLAAVDCQGYQSGRLCLANTSPEQVLQLGSKHLGARSAAVVYLTGKSGWDPASWASAATLYPEADLVVVSVDNSVHGRYVGTHPG